jgi:putative transposase
VPRRRAERALVSVVQEAYVQGIRTRPVDDLVQALDKEVERFRTRQLTGPYPYIW